MSDETKTWYRVSEYFDLGKIEEREVLRDTAQFVFYSVPGWSGNESETRREGKRTEYHTWYSTLEHAVAHARYLLTKRRDDLRAQLARAENALADFNAAHPEN